MADKPGVQYVKYVIERNKIANRVLEGWEDETYPYGNDALLALKARAIADGFADRIEKARPKLGENSELQVFDNPADAWQAWERDNERGIIYRDTINGLYLVDLIKGASFVDWAAYFDFSLWGDASMGGDDYDQMLQALDNPDEHLEYLGLRRVDPESIRP